MGDEETIYRNNVLQNKMSQQNFLFRSPPADYVKQKYEEIKNN